GGPAAQDQGEIQEREAELDDLAQRVGELLREVGLFGPAKVDEIEPGDERGKGHGERQQRPGGPARGRGQQRRRFRPHQHSSTTRRTRTRSFFSAALAVAMISGRLAGSSASGRHMSVTTEMPRVRSPAWTATMTSGTVDMPTTSAPPARRKRYSA